MLDANESNDPLQQLRDLVVGPASQEIDSLREELDSTRLNAERLSDVLPEAIHRSSKKDDRLARSLGPTLSDAFEQSIRDNPQGLADSIAPIMGPAIRRSITQQIQAMVQSLNKTLEHSFSPKSIRWRIEAWQTGKSFAEVVLLHTLVYRVEQLMLIDPNTGLLMTNVAAIENDDAGMVSSLLTAIQDFLRDSFQHESESGSNLRTMHTNELTVWMQHGSKAILAVAIRGEPPISLRENLQSTLEQIHVNYGHLLTAFDGDTDTLEPLRPELEDLLGSEFVNEPKKDERPKEISNSDSPWPARLKLILPVVMAAILALFLWTTQQNRLRTEAIQTAREALETEPGIVLISLQDDGKEINVRGLRDPLSRHPESIVMQAIPETSLKDKFRFSWEPYICLRSDIALRRLKRRLEAMSWLPEHVELEISETPSGRRKLTVTGRAPKKWEQRLRYTSELLGTADEIDLEGCEWEPE